MNDPKNYTKISSIGVMGFNSFCNIIDSDKSRQFASAMTKHIKYSLLDLTNHDFAEFTVKNGMVDFHTQYDNVEDAFNCLNSMTIWDADYYGLIKTDDVLDTENVLNNFDLNNLPDNCFILANNEIPKNAELIDNYRNKRLAKKDLKNLFDESKIILFDKMMNALGENMEKTV